LAGAGWRWLWSENLNFCYNSFDLIVLAHPESVGCHFPDFASFHPDLSPCAGLGFWGCLELMDRERGTFG